MKSTSRIVERLVDPGFWKEWLRRPALDVAEGVIRLRRRRGMTQEDLADAMNTHQPAIARIESGRSNMRISTLVELARALDAVITVELEPAEIVSHCSPRLKWWDDGSRRSWQDADSAFNLSLSTGSDVARLAPRSESLSQALRPATITVKATAVLVNPSGDDFDFQ